MKGGSKGTSGTDRGWEGYEGPGGVAVATAYNALDPEAVNDWLLPHMPAAPAAILDLGSGSGRDAAWLAGQGYEVVAVEPSSTMRSEATRRHRHGAGDRIRWVSDALPDLEVVETMAVAFDLILLSAVWMHVHPSDRARAFRKMIRLLKSGGIIALSLRHGPVPSGRIMHTTSADEVADLARAYGAVVVEERSIDDQMGRADVSWTMMVLRLPDDGTDALPLLRHVILSDAKSSTYKLGLLRAVTRAADGAAGMAAPAGEDKVQLPLGLIALNWLRLYLPLLRADLPQSPVNRSGANRIGFVAADEWADLAGLSPLDLRVGRGFAGPTAEILHRALKHAASTIARMPATFMTWPGRSDPVMPTQLGRAGSAPSALHLDTTYLARFGTIDVPLALWRAMGRFAHWIEPSLIAEWQGLMTGYARTQGRALDSATMTREMTWHEPLRDVSEVRRIAEGLLTQQPLHCVWSGRRLATLTELDVDHCLPWSVWPCGDLWNLMPAAVRVNRHLKRDRLPSAALMTTSAERMADWWQRAYLETGPVTAERFAVEAAGSLRLRHPIETERPLDLGDIHTGVQWRRLALRTDQGVTEWDGVKRA